MEFELRSRFAARGSQLWAKCALLFFCLAATAENSNAHRIAWNTALSNRQMEGLAVGHDGSLYVVGMYYEGNSDAYLTRLSGLGDELWTQRFGTSAADVATSVSVDGAGNVFVTGYSNGAGGFLRKFSPTGNGIWAINALEHGNDLSVTSDSLGNAFVLTQFETTARLQKFGSNGTALWSREFESSSVAVTPDRVGNIYTAEFLYGDGFPRISIEKNDADGDFLWEKSIDFLGLDGSGYASFERGLWLASDLEGNIFASISETVGFDDVISPPVSKSMTLKFSDNEVVWTHRGEARVTSLSVASGGGVFIATSIEEALSGFDPDPSEVRRVLNESVSKISASGVAQELVRFEAESGYRSGASPPLYTKLVAGGAADRVYLSDGLSASLYVDFPRGDFNLDGAVDAADYTVWRDNLGKSMSFCTGADFNCNGFVGNADYQGWKNSFGDLGNASIGPQQVVSKTASVPEPSTFALASWVLAAKLLLARGNVRTRGWVRSARIGAGIVDNLSYAGSIRNAT